MNRMNSDVKVALSKQQDKDFIKMITKASLEYDRQLDLFKLIIKVKNRRRPYIIPIKYNHERKN